ncbi:HAD-IA family hydrolase [Aeromicrobium sp. SMF47]|uniref:HAD-IA family hydrolase n=1 Tax=Aeromicrobium yanjiei TaxID=2662028 RepID=A0A5Q2MFM0_9ACTN|nr:HAD-IA family hydrolase [Aeromicrobium yanjiei]QGG41428.1 HAD-IA family hydrolase [Aeromicrobium yanjiei]
MGVTGGGPVPWQTGGPPGHRSTTVGPVTSYAAVLWDLDGTIVDTEPLWMAAEQELAEAHGKIWTEEDALQLVGNSLIASGEYIRTALEIDMTPEQIVDHLVASLATSLRGNVVWRPGARELIEALDAQGVPQALVTMSYVQIAEPIAEVLPFAAVVTGDAVTRPKPFPDPYLRAAELLGVDASDCLAIEDSATGAASATAAGCDVLAVPHYVHVPVADRRVQVPTLAGLTPADLDGLFG